MPAYHHVDMGEREALLTSSFAAHPEVVEHARAAARIIAERTGKASHQALIVLGSGLAGALESWGEPTASFPLSDLPGVLAPVADGHVNELHSYTVGSVNVLVYCGRTHLYEGHGPLPVVAPVLTAAMTGVERAIITNANGCLRNWALGDLMTIRDHINNTGISPFDGPVFFDVMATWDPELTALLAEGTQRTGVYCIMRGPEYQTMAETVLLEKMGVDAVGMSSIMEALALHRLGVRVGGVSVVSDLSFAEAPTAPDAVVEAAAQASERLANVLTAIVAP